MTNTIWNSADQTSGITLSNLSHTATSTTGGNLGVRATVSHNSGKWFISYSGISAGGGNPFFGFANSTDTLGTIAQMVVDQSGLLHTPNGNYTIGGGNPDGHIVDFAIDIGALLIWVRYDGGNWNGSGTANPTTGTGGFNISLVTVGSGLFPYVWLQNNPASVTLDGGDYPSPTFPYAPPSGYNPWDGPTAPSGTWASTEATDVFAAIGYPGAPGVVGDWASTEATDIAAFVVATGVVGTFVTSESPDIFLALGAGASLSRPRRNFFVT